MCTCVSTRAHEYGRILVYVKAIKSELALCVELPAGHKRHPRKVSSNRIKGFARFLPLSLLLHLLSHIFYYMFYYHIFYYLSGWLSPRIFFPWTGILLFCPFMHTFWRVMKWVLYHETNYQYLELLIWTTLYGNVESNFFFPSIFVFVVDSNSQIIIVILTKVL